MHRGEAEHYRTNLKSLQGGGQSTLARDQVRAKDGSIHWIETHAGPYRRADGRVEGIVASFRLIDDIVAAEQARELARPNQLAEVHCFYSRHEIINAGQCWVQLGYGDGV